jgi:hypothetical protein
MVTGQGLSNPWSYPAGVGAGHGLTEKVLLVPPHLRDERRQLVTA